MASAAAAGAASGCGQPPNRLSMADIACLLQSGKPLPPSLLAAGHRPALLSLFASPPPSFTIVPALSSLLSLLSDSISSDPSLASLFSSLLFLFVSGGASVAAAGDGSKVFQLFSFFLSLLPTSEIPSVVDGIVSALPDAADPDGAAMADLLPCLLSLARSAAATGEIEDAAGYVDSVLGRILAVPWSKTLSVKLVSLLRELPPMAKSRSRDFLTKVFVELKGLDLQDIPAIAYQLLVLASNGFAKKMILGGIVRFFGERGAGAPIERQVEGTALLHFNFAVKQDPSLGQEVIALVRSDPGCFNHFVVSVILSVSRIRRFSESAMAVLKKKVLSAHRDYQFARDCEWIPECVKKDCLQAYSGVEKAIIGAVNDCGYGREHIVPSMVQFGFLLLESVDVESGRSLEQDGLMGILELGIQIVRSLFEVHDMARNEIIEQCKFRIITLKNQQSLSMIKLLGSLVQSYPYPMLEHVGRLKELLDYFTFMPEKVSISLATSILPLIKFSHDLQNYLVLVLRKALFKKEDDVRAAAISVVIELIMAEKRFNSHSMNSMQDSSSQASCSQQADLSCGPGSNLFQDLSGLLRRCLSQQARIKVVLYKGLLKLVILEPHISSAVFDLLWPHFIPFYEEDTSHMLKISNCLKLVNGKVCFEEPLDALLSCVSWILVLQLHSKSTRFSEFSWTCLGFSLTQDNEIGRVSSRQHFSTALLKLRNFLRKCSFEGVVSLCGQDSSSDSSQCEKSICCTWILIGVVEVVLNIVVAEIGKDECSDKEYLEREFVGLIDLYHSLTKSLSRNRRSITAISTRDTSHGVDEETDGTAKENHQNLPQNISQSGGPFFSTSNVHQLLLSALRPCTQNGMCDSICKSNSQLSASKISELEDKLVTVALNVCHNHLKLLTSVDDNDPTRTLLYEDVNVLGRPLLELIFVFKNQAKLEKSKRHKESKGEKALKKSGEFIYLSSLCMKKLFKINLQQGSSFSFLTDSMMSGPLIEQDLKENLADLGCADTELEQLSGTQETRSIQLFLWKVIRPLLSELLGLLMFREFEVASEIVLMLANALPYKLRNAYGAWVVNICKKCSIKNSKAVKSVVALVINLKAYDDSGAAQDFASELVKVIGSEDMDPVEKSEKFPIINRSTVSSISLLLLKLLQSTITDLGWAVEKLKVLTILSYWESTEVDSEDLCHERSTLPILEEAIYSRSEAVVHLLSSFAEMNLKGNVDDPQAEQILKLSAKFYKHLAQITKLLIAPRGCRQPRPGLTFQKLAEVACKKLTAPLYNFMALVQRNQQENAQGKRILNKIKREEKCIPDLIFQIEDYEKYLIQLSKLTKINLLKHAKRSTARDFRILKAKPREDQREDEGNHEYLAASENHSSEESEGKENESQEVASPELCQAADVQNSSSDNEDEGLIIKRKKAKRSEVVEDSD